MSFKLKKNKNNPHMPKPVENIEINDKNIRLRIIFCVGFLVLGLVLIGYSVNSCLSMDPGWRIITTENEVPDIDVEFIFNYNIGKSGITATAEYKAVSLIYKDTARHAAQVFALDSEFDSVGNLCTVNSHPNETVKVDSLLYEAFRSMKAHDNKLLYYAPIFEEYQNIFFAGTDANSVDNDPQKNPELNSYFKDIISFIENEDNIQLELLGDNSVILHISEAYMTFAKENGFKTFIDFCYLKNAFITDALADSLIKEGYRNGYVSSYNGFTRNLDNSGENYSLNIFDRLDNEIVSAAVMSYSKGESIVSFRAFPISSLDSERCTVYPDGTTVCEYFDLSDGIYKSAVPCLTAYSTEFDCVDIALASIPFFISDEIDTSILKENAKIGIYSIFASNSKLYHTDSNIVLTNIHSSDESKYKTEYIT